jgi:hypothetical protein
MPDPTPAKGAPADAKADKPKVDAAAPGAQPLEEWKPEPRQWTWKDLFTAPMLAFKPKCMLIMALTLAAITAVNWLFDTKIVDQSNGLIITGILSWVQVTIGLVLFSLGASLVAVFLKADLLDDEFLSLSEALAQYKTRILPAVMVPVFLMGLLAGVYVVLVYLPYLGGSIPYVGPALYALLYPLAFLFSLFLILLSIAVWLSVFVFPAIIAIRKHGWFDNVVDTIEAVGTKPHVLFASLLLSGVMILVAGTIGMGSISQLKSQWRNLPTSMMAPLRDTEARASDFAPDPMMDLFDRHLGRHVLGGLPVVGGSQLAVSGAGHNQGETGFYQYVTGPVTGVWQVLIQALILGYLGNLFVAGGMLTYLVVREDDYWDDENLEDLDKLAKELEEEAKRDQGVADAKPAEPVKAPEAAKPPEPPPAPPAEPAKPAEPPKA